MVGGRIHMLLVEDDKIDRQAFERHVHKMDLPYDYRCATSSAQARDFLEKETFDVVLLDYLLGDGIGTELLPLLNGAPGIIITGEGSEEVAANAMRKGAYDYVIKDAECKFLTVLPLTIGTVLERKKAEQARDSSSQRYRALTEFANAVIHNVANMLTSINTSCHQVKTGLIKSKITCLEKVNRLLEEYADEPFFSEHTKGQHLPPYMKNLAAKLEKERETMLAEIRGVLKNLELVGDIIQTQQSQEIGAEPLVRFQLDHVVDNALWVSLSGRKKSDLDIVNKVDPDISLRSHKSMITHVLVNVFKNALESMSETSGPRVLKINTRRDEGERCILSVTDSGSGIASEDIDRLFEHGYTTKANGHGFGLHYSALAMNEIGGHVVLESPGPGLGATITLTFPPYAG